MSELTEEERAALAATVLLQDLRDTIATVEHIVATRTADLSARVEAVVETLPRNEFGDEHYLAVEAAYANVIRELRAALAPHTPTDAARAVDAENGEEHG